MKRCMSLIAVCVLTLFVPGCYEEVSSPSQTQVQPPSQPSSPLPEQASQSTGSALGGAKRAATNIVDQAEEASRKTAEQADDLYNSDDE